MICIEPFLTPTFIFYRYFACSFLWFSRHKNILAFHIQMELFHFGPPPTFNDGCKLARTKNVGTHSTHTTCTFKSKERRTLYSVQ